MIAGTVAFSVVNLIATLTAASADSNQQFAAFTLVFISPLTSTLNVGLCIPLMLVATWIDKGEGPQEYQRVGLRKPGLLLSCYVVIVFVDAFLAVPQIHSMLAGRSLAANIAAVPHAVIDARWLYLVSAVLGAAVYDLIAKWLMSESASS